MTTSISVPRRWWVLGALSTALLAFGLDVTILNVALPTLAVELPASTSQLQWFASAYTLVLAAGLLPAGLLGDKYGPKKLLIAALAIFGLASVACAYAMSPGFLIIARVALGIGGALMVPLSMSVVLALFPGADRSRAIAAWSAAMAVGIPLGPVVGGWLLNTFWWGSVFLINVPFAVIGMVTLVWLLPDLPGRPHQVIDLPGIVLSGAGLAALTYGLIEAGEQGWSDGRALLPMLGGGLLLVGFGAWLRHARHPLIDTTLFRSAGFTWGTVLATVSSFALMGAMFVLPQFFQAVDGADALGTGLRLLPVVGGLLAGVRIADLLRPRWGAKAAVACGFATMGTGLLMGTATDPGGGYGFVAVWVTVLGVGLGLSLPPAMDIAMGALADGHGGAGSGLLQAMRQIGGTFGVAILGTALGARYAAGVEVAGLPPAAAGAVRDSAASGVRTAEITGAPGLLESVRAAFTSGMSITLWICAGAAALGVVLTLAFLPWRPEDVVEAQSEHDYLTR